ncbi:MAG TPA: hypothetical protein VFZ98_00475 [Vicinamibacterales bacterium]
MNTQSYQAPRTQPSATSTQHRTQPTRRQWIILVCLFLVSLAAVTPRIYSSDEIQYFAFLRSLWFDHDLSFENEYRYFYDRGIARSDGFRETFLELQTDTGRRVNFGTIGCAILWSPFYAMGDLVARATGAPRDGFSRPYLAAVAYGSAVYGFLALVLAIRCAARLGFNAFTGALAVWIGTPLLFYMYVAPPFSHACSAFAVALFTWVWLRVRGEWSPRGMAALGASGALMLMVREQDVFFAVAVALDYGLWAPNAQSLKSTAQSILAAAAAFVVVYAPQAAAYLIVNGHLGPHASVGNKMQWWAPHAFQVMFSPEHGYFMWTPLAMIAIAGLVALAFRRASEAAILLLMVALQIYVDASVASWTVAGGFAQRRLVSITTALVIGYAAAWHLTHGRPARVAVAAVTLLAVYWNLALTAEFATGLMDRQRLEPRRNAYDAFVTLPRMAPSLVYRYLFDRSSFYQRANPVPR